jgi:hypothetical protein
MVISVSGSYTTYHVYEDGKYMNTCKWYLNDNDNRCEIHTIHVSSNEDIYADYINIDSNLEFSIENVTVLGIKLEYIYVYNTHYEFGYSTSNSSFGEFVDQTRYEYDPYIFNDIQNKKVCEIVSKITNEYDKKLESCCWIYCFHIVDMRRFLENIK